MNKYIEFNYNEFVEVKLNQRGRDFLQDSGISYTEVDGWTRFQLWNLMEIFGPFISLGAIPMLEATIRVAKKKAPPFAQLNLSNR